MNDFHGRFVWLGGSECPDFHCDDGEILFAIDVEDKPDVPLNEHLVVTLDGDRLVTYRRDQSEVAPDRSTRRKIALVLVADNPSEIDLSKHKERAKRTQDHYNRAMQGHRVAQVDPFVMPRPAGSQFTLRDRVLWGAARELVGREYTHLHVVGGSSQYCGRAPIGGTEALTFNPWQCWWTTTGHEDGHNNGCHHSAKNGVEYGERRRIMGSGGGRMWFNAPHLINMDAIDPDHIAEHLSDEPGTSYLVWFNTLELAVPSGADRAIVLRQNHEHRLVCVSLDDDNRLDVHVPFYENSRSWSKTNHVQSMSVGETFEVAGRSIYFDSYVDGMAKVVIDDYTNGSVWPSYPPSDAVGFDDCAGVWGNPQWGAQGVHIVPHGPGELYVAWLTWDYNYNPVWYSGVVSIISDIAAGKLEADGEQVDVMFAFSDAENGVFYASVGHEAFATPLKRVSKALTSSVHQLGNGTIMTIETATNGVVFGYLLEVVVHPPLGRKEVRWRMFQDGRVYEVSGGMRGVKADVEREVVSEIAINGDSVTIDGLVHSVHNLP